MKKILRLAMVFRCFLTLFLYYIALSINNTFKNGLWCLSLKCKIG